MANGELTGDALVAAHREMTRKMRVVTLAFPLILMLIVVGYLITILNQIKAVDLGAVGASFSSKASSLWPEIDDHLISVASEAQPVLAKALQDVAVEMGPQFEQRLQGDIEQMTANLERDFRAAVAEALETVRERQRAILVREVPEIAHNQTKQDKVLDSVQDAVVKWSVRQLNTRFDDHLVAMEEIRKTLEKSYMHPEGVPAAPEDALSIWLDLMNESIGGEESALIPDDKKTKKKPYGREVPVDHVVLP